MRLIYPPKYSSCYVLRADSGIATKQAHPMSLSKKIKNTKNKSKYERQGKNKTTIFFYIWNCIHTQKRIPANVMDPSSKKKTHPLNARGVSHDIFSEKLIT